VWRNWGATDVCFNNCDTTFTNSIYPFGALVDPMGYKWIGIWSGPLTRFNDEVDPPQFINNIYNSTSADTSERHSFIWSTAVDDNPGANGGRWFGLDSNNRDGRPPQGIDLYDSSGAFVRSFLTDYPGLRNGQVRGLALDHKTNTMWVAYAQNSTAGLSTFPVPDTIGHDIVLSDVANTKLFDCFAVQIYGDSVWVLESTGGLHRFDRATKSEMTRLDIAGHRPVLPFRLHDRDPRDPARRLRPGRPGRAGRRVGAGPHRPRHDDGGERRPAARGAALRGGRRPSTRADRRLDVRRDLLGGDRRQRVGGEGSRARPRSHRVEARGDPALGRPTARHHASPRADRAVNDPSGTIDGAERGLPRDQRGRRRAADVRA